MFLRALWFDWPVELRAIHLQVDLPVQGLGKYCHTYYVMQHDAHVETRRIYYLCYGILLQFHDIRSVRNSQLNMRAWLNEDGTTNDHWNHLEAREKKAWDRAQEIAQDLPVPSMFDMVCLERFWITDQWQRSRTYVKDGKGKTLPKFAIIGGDYKFWVAQDPDGHVYWVDKTYKVVTAQEYLEYVKELRAQRKERRQIKRDLLRHVKECPPVPSDKRRPVPLAQWKKAIVAALLDQDVLEATVDGTTMRFANLDQRDNFIKSIGGPTKRASATR